MTGTPIWDFVDESLHEALARFTASWSDDKPIASRIKVALRPIGTINPWLECAVCAVAFEGRRALGVITTDITQAVLGADAFTCVLPGCLFGGKSLERCRTCLYGLPTVPRHDQATKPHLPRTPSSSRDEPGPTAASAGTPLARLSAQQLAVLRLIAVGKQNKHIAAELGLAEATVKGYIHRILKILNLPNRTSAALLYRQCIALG
ncbi:MAG: response regulator transcription factor [Alphaproteobacteria bacterium]|nr:response regulator transcription factor [Alphaproteobacteria bacterium]